MYKRWFVEWEGGMRKRWVEGRDLKGVGGRNKEECERLWRFMVDVLKSGGV